MNVKYIGFIGVKESMKRLGHKNRSDVAKESIKRLCQANNICINSNSNNNDNDLDRKQLCSFGLLEDEPNLDYSGTDVQLVVTSTHLKLICIETQKVLIQHEMPYVSFASTGDEGALDFVGYVAKNDLYGRACFVLECSYGSATHVLETIARQFQLRTQQILTNSTLPRPQPNRPTTQDRFSVFNNETTILEGTNFKSNNNGINTVINNNNHNTVTTSGNTSHVYHNSVPPTDSLVALTRALLEKEPWFHGSYLSREASEFRLKQDGDFLVRESMLDPGNFVLSVMHNGEKLHLLFDSIGLEVKTRSKTFNNISHLVKYHHDEGLPIVADNRCVYLSNGVRPNPTNKS